MPHSSRLPLLLLLLAPPLQAQVDNSGLLRYMPADVQHVREQQAELAESTGVTVSFHDEGMRSATGLRGIPEGFRTLIVTNEQDLIQRIEELYPYFGFRGTETLRYDSMREVLFERQYLFIEYINGIPTPQMLSIHVEPASGLITRFNGSPVLDRGFPSASAISKVEAIACGLDYIQRLGWAASHQLDGAHKAEQVYRWGEGRVLEPWWAVSIANKNGDTNIPQFLVGPYETVISFIMTDHAPQKEYGYCDTSTLKGVGLAPRVSPP